jgi:hypothetical protein
MKTLSEGAWPSEERAGQHAALRAACQHFSFLPWVVPDVPLDLSFREVL